MGEGAFIAEINPEETAISERVDCAVRSTAAQVLPKLIDAL
jgi:NAD-dependent SIR2 family protein deacetylase